MYLDDMDSQQLKDYIRGLYAIPLAKVKQTDRQNLREAKAELLKKGFETVCVGNDKVKFVKAETHIKKLMQGYISEYGLNDVDRKRPDGTHIFLVAPNHLGQGYIKIITPDKQAWSGDLKKGDPTKVTSVKFKNAEQAGD